MFLFLFEKLRFNARFHKSMLSGHGVAIQIIFFPQIDMPILEKNSGEDPTHQQRQKV